jgi:hypothetical protein
MSDDSSALATATFPSPQTDADYDAICAALMETARGRAFLAEHARRSRSADIAALLAASERIEAAMRDAPAADVTAQASPSSHAASDDTPADFIPESGQPSEHAIDERVPAISWFDAMPAPAAEPSNEAPSSTATSAREPVSAATADDFADLLFEPGLPPAPARAMMGEPKPDTLWMPLDVVIPDWTETHAGAANGSAAAATPANPERHRVRLGLRTSDPLAPLKAMSDEEKIALFS